MSLDVALLGGFRLTFQGELLLEINQARQQSLLAYLMLHADAPQSRRHLAYLFWPDSSESQARTNLRYALHHLRRAFPEIERYWHVETMAIHWQPTAPFRLDVAEFDRLLVEAAADDGDVRRTLERAIDLYRGELLPSCYDDWIVPFREQLRQRYVLALERLIDLLEAAGEFGEAIGYAARLQASDPLREATYRRLMRLHQAQGDRAAALRVFQQCADVLDRELGVAPGAETRTLHKALLDEAATPVLSSGGLAAVRDVPTIKLVGRDAEWRQLQAAWVSALAGQPHFVLITGEAGIGKTRLAEEILAHAGRQGGVTARSRFFSAEGQLAYAPVVEWLRSAMVRDRLVRLEDVWLIELSRLLPELLVRRPDLSRPPPMAGNWQRRRLFEALARAVLVAGPPLLLHVDDLQWADQETLEWLRFLLRFDARARLLVTGTARTEELDPNHPLTALLLELARDEQITTIELEPLGCEATATLARCAGEHMLEAPALAALYDQTGGVPLFVVETVRAGLAPTLAQSYEQHSPEEARAWRPPQTAALPPKVYAVLRSRLAQLSQRARELVSAAAVIGHAFDLELLGHLCHGGEERLVQTMDELWQRRILREQSPATYDFSHDRIRDVAYAELSPIWRRVLHRRVAAALLARHASDVDAVSGQVAMHYDQGGMPTQAIAFYRRAGSVARQVYANAEAIELLSRALSLLEGLPESRERDQEELELWLAMAPCIRVTRGWVARDLTRLMDRAWTLYQRVGDVNQRFQVLLGRSTVYAVFGMIDVQHQMATQSLALARRSGSPVHLVIANNQLGGSNNSLGNFDLAHRQFAEAFRHYDTRQHDQHVSLVGPDYGVLTLAWHAHNLWLLGYPDQALAMSGSAMELADELAHPFSQAQAMAYRAMLHQFRGEIALVCAHAEATAALAAQHDEMYYRAWAAILVAWARAATQPTANAIQELCDALAAFRSSEAGLRLPYYLALLARLYGEIGQFAAALALLDEALATAAAHQEHWWDAEIHRLRAEVWHVDGQDVDQVELELRTAIDIARGQQTRSLELRASTSLARLWASQGRLGGARDLLAAIYDWFTEGFDTGDLQAARLLLDRLQ